MPEIVSIFIGQAGVQIGNACWELFGLEHGIAPDGHASVNHCDDNTFSTIYSESFSSKFVPRAVLIDLEPTVIDEIRTGVYKQLFNPTQLISGKEDAANNFARGMCTVGRKLLDTVKEAICRTAENCEDIQGFMIYHAFGGGTGSGLTSLVCNALSHDYPKKSRLQMAVYPASLTATAIVEPYNALLCANGTSKFIDVSFLFDNESTYRICMELLGVEKPAYTNINRMVAQVVSSLTSSLRYQSSLKVDLNEFQTNLVPFPKIHYPIISYSPFMTPEQNHHTAVSTCDITKSCFESDHQMIECNNVKGKYLACVMLYRGDVAHSEIYSSISKLKNTKRIEFVDWVPTGFKVGVCDQPPTVVPGGDIAKVSKACCLLSNNTAILESWDRLAYKFDLLFSKRAFVHWYTGEGMEEAELAEARDAISVMVKDYEEIDMDTTDYQLPTNYQDDNSAVNSAAY